MVPSAGLTATIIHVRMAQGFRDFLQELQKNSVRVLVTSRCQLGGGLQSARHLHLTSLSPKHAVDLLCRWAGADQVAPPQAEKLAGICGNNALALTIIGGFIASQVVTAEVRPVSGASTTGLDCVCSLSIWCSRATACKVRCQRIVASRARA